MSGRSMGFTNSCYRAIFREGRSIQSFHFHRRPPQKVLGGGGFTWKGLRVAGLSCGLEIAEPRSAQNGS
eukprot:5023226-Prymnesium_polylepis.1